MKAQLNYKFEDIVSVENLLEAWTEFLKGKKRRNDVRLFQLNLMDNILLLHRNILNHTYKHGGYQAFNISDPKPRNIHKASVKDRLLHHAIYRKLYPFFDRTFISESFSCRKGKGTHKALECFRQFSSKVSENKTKTCWILKCDIKKFFASVDHNILLEILERYIYDEDIFWLLWEVIESFNVKPGVGLPLGNLTSQLLVNIYMNEFDQFIKHNLKVKYYIRYADDFVLFSKDRSWLLRKIPEMERFLRERLHLKMHPKKITTHTLASGVDFLGWVNFPHHKVIRTSTKRRIIRRVRENPKPETLASYLGLLSHGNTYKIRREYL